MKRNILLIVLSLVTVSALASGGYKVGDKVQDFELKNIDGNKISLKDMEENQGVIMIFTCNHCPYSVAYEERIIELDKKYKSQGFPVVAVNPNDPARFPTDSYEHMQKRAEEKGFTFPYLFDETQEMARAYGASRTPHAYLLQNKGDHWEVAYIGAIDNNVKAASAVTKPYLADAIEAVKAGKKPKPNFTKAIGCSIKWKM